MAGKLTTAMAEAKKVLGKDAKIPTKYNAAVFKSFEELHKQGQALATAAGALEKHVTAIQNATAKYKASLQQAEDELTGDDYGLDSKNKDEKKKIDTAQKIFADCFKDLESSADTTSKAMREFDKHLMHINTYKGPA